MLHPKRTTSDIVFSKAKREPIKGLIKAFGCTYCLIGVCGCLVTSNGWAARDIKAPGRVFVGLSGVSSDRKSYGTKIIDYRDNPSSVKYLKYVIRQLEYIMSSGKHPDKVLTDAFGCQASDVRKDEGDEIWPTIKELIHGGHKRGNECSPSIVHVRVIL